MALKIDFECQGYALLKKYVDINQGTTWQVEAGLCGDGCTMRLLNKNKFPFFTNFACKLTFTTKLLFKIN